MKKALLGTSALVGAGLLAFSPAPASANDLELSISGNLLMGAYILDGDDVVISSSTYTNDEVMLVGTAGTAQTGAPVCLGAGTYDDDDEYVPPTNVFVSATGAACGPTARQIGTANVDTGGDITGFTTVTINGVQESNSFGISRGPSRIVFDSKGVLDNGLTVGSRVRLEARTVSSADDVIDEHYVWVEGGFGLFQVGAKNAAAYQMHAGAPWGTNNGVDSPNFRITARAESGAATETYTNLTEDAYKINYFTPRFGGVQLGVSYVPNGSAKKGTSGVGYDANYGGPGSVDLQNIYSLGVNYVNAVGDVDVRVSGGYESGTARDKGPQGVPTNFEDPTEWSVGTQLGMSGVTVGGAYNVRENNGFRKDEEVITWSAGAGYGEGPWSVNIGYLESTVEYPSVAGVTSPDNEGTMLLLNGGYTLGTGVNLGVDLQVVEDTIGDEVAPFQKSVKSNAVGMTLGLNF